MQKFLVVEIITTAEGRIGAPVNAFGTEEDAVAKFHTVMAAAAKSAHPVHACTLLTAEGFQLRYECVKHEVQPAPEPESE
jgi:hypothetical protein